MPATTTGAPAADVGPVTALATEVFLGDPSRFAGGHQVASYIGMIACEHTSGKRPRLGKMPKEGNSLLRYLWTEATLHAVRKDPELKRFYGRKLIQKGMGKARIAVARKLGIRLWIMMRDQINYEEFCPLTSQLVINRVSDNVDPCQALCERTAPCTPKTAPFRSS